jgi:hypothetical protein
MGKILEATQKRWVIRELLEKKKSTMSPNIIVLWG